MHIAMREEENEVGKQEPMVGGLESRRRGAVKPHGNAVDPRCEEPIEGKKPPRRPLESEDCPRLAKAAGEAPALLWSFPAEQANSPDRPETGRIDCNDSDACTTDTCNPATGCVHTPVVCDDNDACTADACVAGQCVYTAVVCNDNNVCTDDVCDVLLGCVYTNNTAPCDDGNACTGGVSGCNIVGVCTGMAIVFENNTPVTIPTGPGVVTSSITVSGTGGYLQRLRMPTFMLHTNDADLDVTIQSPAGTIVTITSDNGGTLPKELIFVSAA